MRSLDFIGAGKQSWKNKNWSNDKDIWKSIANEVNYNEKVFVCGMEEKEEKNNKE